MEKTKQNIPDSTEDVPEQSFQLSPALERRLDATFDAPDLPSRTKAARKFQQFYTEEQKRRKEREDKEKRNEASKR